MNIINVQPPLKDTSSNFCIVVGRYIQQQKTGLSFVILILYIEIITSKKDILTDVEGALAGIAILLRIQKENIRLVGSIVICNPE